jgi:hypothetical protein
MFVDEFREDIHMSTWHSCLVFLCLPPRAHLNRELDDNEGPPKLVRLFIVNGIFLSDIGLTLSQ